VIGGLVLHAPLDAMPIAQRVPATIEGLIRSFGESHTASSPVFQQPIFFS
jgi:hypothetical protein